VPSDHGQLHAIPPSGTFVGPDGVVSGASAVIGANVAEHHVDPTEFIDNGDRVVVRGRLTGRHQGGAALDTGFTHTIDMRDGKGIRFANTPDAAAAWIGGRTGEPRPSGAAGPGAEHRTEQTRDPVNDDV